MFNCSSTRNSLLSIAQPSEDLFYNNHNDDSALEHSPLQFSKCFHRLLSQGTLAAALRSRHCGGLLQLHLHT